MKAAVGALGLMLGACGVAETTGLCSEESCEVSCSGDDCSPTGATFLAEEVGLDTDLREHPEILWYPLFENIDDVRADWSLFPHMYTGATWPKVDFVDAPEFGIGAARFESVSLDPDTRNAGDDNSQIMNWRKYLNADSKQMWTGTAIGAEPLNDLYFRYCVMMEADVLAGINELGVKLSGLKAFNDTASTTMWHEQPDDQDHVRLTTYWFGGDLQPGWYGGDWLQGHELVPDQWRCIEQRYRVNTRNPDGTPNADAIIEVWLDDTLVFSRKDFIVHSDATLPVEIQSVHGQIYHGGQSVPLHPIHYQVTGFALAKRRIGMPRHVQD